MEESYKHPPGFFTRKVFNPLVVWYTRRGLSLAGSRILEVTGRKSGEPRRTPVNPLNLGSSTYLVAPRGNTEWVRNLRVSERGRLIARNKTVDFTAEELEDAAKVPVIKAYLKRWKWEVGAFFDGVGPDSSEEELLRIGPDHPVFRISMLSP